MAAVIILEVLLTIVTDHAIDTKKGLGCRVLDLGFRAAYCKV